MTVQVLHGDCLEVLRGLDDCSVDAVITDPPYGLSNTKPAQVADVLKAWVTGDTKVVPAGKGFMGKDWDGFVPPPAVWEECMRVLKPGGHMAVFAGARTQDLMGLSIRLAGFEIRDTLGWVYGSGFPKSHDIGKAIDKAAGAEREVVGKYTHPATGKPHGDFRTDNDRSSYQSFDMCDDTRNITAPATSEAQQWSGWGTALKPAIEPIILARKPLVGTVAANVLAHGVGGLNIDASRVAHNEPVKETARTAPRYSGAVMNGGKVGGIQPSLASASPAGRFPANVLLDEHAAQEMDKQSGHLSPGARPGNTSTRPKFNGATYNSGKVYDGKIDEPRTAMDSGGGASRFFPVFKSEEGTPETKGRFPANVLLDEHAAQEMDKQSGVSKSPGDYRRASVADSDIYGDGMGARTEGDMHKGHGDSGGASRFFPVFKYQAKAPKKERPVVEREDGTKIQHPTVKPEKLMEWLVELITPPGGTVLDPFAGSGTTLQAALNKGFTPIGIEQDADYIKLIDKRLEVGSSTHNS